MKTRVKIIFSVLLSLIIFTSSLFLSPTAFASEVRVVDTYYDTQYSISQSDNVVTIQSAYTSSQISIDRSVVQATCYAGNFVFLCTSVSDSGDVIYYVYFYNINTEDFRFFTTNHNAPTGYPSFTADLNKNVYLTDGYDKRTMWIYSEYTSSNVLCPDYILQLMCIDGKNVLAFTASGVFIFANNTFTKIPDIKPVPPCSYTYNGIITDQESTEFVYKAGTLQALNSPATKPAKTDSSGSFSDKDVFIKDNCIYLKQSKTYASLCDYFDVAKDDFILYKQDGSTLSSGKLSTGMSAVYNSKKYTVVVMGDLTGEGNVNSRDLKALMKHLTGEVRLTDTAEKSADLNFDNTINTKDLLTLASLY